MRRILIRMGFALDLSGATSGIRVGDAASFVFVALGGQAPYQLRMLEEDLPSEWTYADNGDGTFTVSTGAAVEPGTYTFTITVRDALRQRIARTYSVYVQPLALTLTGSPDPASEEIAYTFNLTRAGGQGAINITEQYGFPDGVSAAVLGTTVQIAGTPEAGTSAGSPYAPSVTIQDEAGQEAVWSEELTVSGGTGFPVNEGNVGSIGIGPETLQEVDLTTTGPLNDGDLLIILMYTNSTGAVTTPDGWTQIDDALLNATETGNGRFGCYYRVVDGSEAAAVEFETADSCRNVAMLMRYAAGTFTAVPEIVAIGGSSTDPDPPSLSPTWGTEKTQWVAIHCNDQGSDVAVYPFDNGTDNTISEPALGGISLCREDDETPTKNPPAYEIDPTSDWRAYTLAIRGVG